MTIEELKKAKEEMETDIGEAIQKFIDSTNGVRVSEVFVSLDEMMDSFIVEKVETSIIL
jgi:hypothetical protein